MILELNFVDESCDLDDTVFEWKVNKVINSYQIKNPLLLNKGMPKKWESFDDFGLENFAKIEPTSLQKRLFNVNYLFLNNVIGTRPYHS